MLWGVAGIVAVVAIVACVLAIAVRSEDDAHEEAAAAGAIDATILTANHRLLEFWLARTDPRTGLEPNFLPSYTLQKPKGPNAKGPHYSPADSGADHFPFQVINSYLTDRTLFDTRMPAMLLAERKFAQLPDGRLPEWVDLTRAELGPPSAFAAAEYAKDGLLSITGLIGESIYSERMVELVQMVMTRADTPTAFGALPGPGAEINGDLLMVLVPLAWAERAKPAPDDRYAAWAKRIVDAYVFEVMPNNAGLPSHEWDFTAHRGNAQTHLRDHGNEIIAGIVLYYCYLRGVDRTLAVRDYLPAVRTMIDRVLASANPDGLLYNRIDSRTLKPLTTNNSGRLADSWGYVYGAVYNFFLVTGDERYRDATLNVMRNLPAYIDYKWSTYPGHDDYADALESAIYLLAREDVPEAWQFVDALFSKLMRYQRPDGSIGGSYLDGNWTRSTLLYALHKSQGVRAVPWQPGLALGAAPYDEGIVIDLTSPSAWSGHLVFDTARHLTIFNMQTNFVRLNEWPEWFTVDPARSYMVTRPNSVETVRGSDLIAGLPVTAPARLSIQPVPEPAR